ncbi:hypothetical protein BKA67DRAFT_580474 [Truncatella angustata]|uniref:Uncharacterized protein n=1 Tax=Truncatella angustata TaxID=152316 RepID=A0A9P8RMI8_9PEZI|nr:uncharacterized protein BKA67DRAFT_580474 [Truncatella angustata]KAH6646756.1 hypothetical protein BKA67DRAFT_580474 [Truncatella angustata]
MTRIATPHYPYPWNLLAGFFLLRKACTGFWFSEFRLLNRHTISVQRLGEFTTETEEVCLLNCATFFCVRWIPRSDSLRVTHGNYLRLGQTGRTNGLQAGATSSLP